MSIPFAATATMVADDNVNEKKFQKTNAAKKLMLQRKEPCKTRFKADRRLNLETFLNTP